MIYIVYFLATLFEFGLMIAIATLIEIALRAIAIYIDKRWLPIVINIIIKAILLLMYCNHKGWLVGYW